jgi:hypothetical protein
MKNGKIKKVIVLSFACQDDLHLRRARKSPKKQTWLLTTEMRIWKIQAAPYPE